MAFHSRIISCTFLCPDPGALHSDFKPTLFFYTYERSVPCEKAFYSVEVAMITLSSNSLVDHVYV